MTADLAGFLLARIAEDEAAATAASYLAPSGPDPAYVSPLDNLLRLQQRYDPPHVLAECEAKRRIVEIHPIYPDGDQHDCPGRWPCYQDAPNEPCPTLRLLALPYADHPEYDESWRP